MIPRSFTWRLTLVSTALSGIVLAGFAVWGLHLVRRSILTEFDSELYELTWRHALQPRLREPWDQIEDSIIDAVGDPRNVTMLVLEEGGRVVYRSKNWPETLSPESFPQPYRRIEPPRREGPGPPPRPGLGSPPREARPEDWRRRQDVPGEASSPDVTPVPHRLDEPFRPERAFRGPPPSTQPDDLRPPTFRTFDDDNVRWRLAVVGNPYLTLVVGRNQAPVDAQLRTLYLQFLGVAVAALMLMGFVGRVVARRAIHPVEQLTAAAERITAKDLHARIPSANAAAEFDRLIAVFNGMLERLQRSFEQANRFSADAAHELKTPLTILRGELERAVQDADAGSEQQQIYSALLEEVQRLRMIIRKLLLLSMADSGQLRVNREPVTLSDIVECAVEDARILAPNLSFDLDIADPVVVRADPPLVRQVVQNLLNNACKYNRKHGAVRVRGALDDGEFRLSVANTGPAIPESDRARVFDRFYRVDKARSRLQGGAGLGLSLSREIARAHGGDLRLARSDEQWTEFELVLPIS